MPPAPRPLLPLPCPTDQESRGRRSSLARTSPDSASIVRNESLVGMLHRQLVQRILSIATAQKRKHFPQPHCAGSDWHRSARGRAASPCPDLSAATARAGFRRYSVGRRPPCSTDWRTAARSAEGFERPACTSANWARSRTRHPATASPPQQKVPATTVVSPSPKRAVIASTPKRPTRLFAKLFECGNHRRVHRHPIDPAACSAAFATAGSGSRRSCKAGHAAPIHRRLPSPVPAPAALHAVPPAPLKSLQRPLCRRMFGISG